MEDLLRLARNPAVQMSILAAGNRAEVSKAAAGFAAAARAEWEREIRATVTYIRLVRGNNLDRGEAVMKRPDVLYSIQKATEAAAKLAVLRVESGWAAGVGLGFDHAGSEASKAGVQSNGSIELPDGLLQSLLKDTKTLTDDAATKLGLASGADDWESQLTKLSKQFGLRAQMIAEASVKEAHNLAKVESLKDSESEGMWVAYLKGKPCSHCRRLHGMKRAWGDLFPDSFPDLPELGTHGPLTGPPRHPNCKCILTPVPK